MKTIDRRIKVISGETYKKILAVALRINKVISVRTDMFQGFVEVEYDRELEKDSVQLDVRNLIFYMITFFLIVYYRIAPANWSLLIIALICINILWRKEIYYRGLK